MHRFVSVEALFNGRHFHGQIIILCVSWYTSFKLSFRDLVIIMAERGIYSLIRPSCVGSSTTCRNSRSAGSVTHGQSAAPGGWMKHISRSADNGSTYTGR